MNTQPSIATVELLKSCYEEDRALLEQFHIAAPADAETCARRTVEDLKNAVDFSFFTVHKNNDLVGFYGAEHLGNLKALTSFFVRPRYRDSTDEFWSLLQAHFKGPFVSGLYNKNTRAIRFFERQGGKLVCELDDQDGRIYLFKSGEKICH